MRNLIKSRSDPKSPSLRLFIDILYNAAVVIARTINSQEKKAQFESAEIGHLNIWFPLRKVDRTEQ